MILTRQREPGLDDDAPPAREAREAARRAIRLLAPASSRMALRGDADSLEVRIVAAGAVDDVDSLADRLGDLLARPVAISRAFTSAAERPAAEAEARATLEAALALDRPPRLARADRLAVYRMLSALHKVPDARRWRERCSRPSSRRDRMFVASASRRSGRCLPTAASARRRPALGVHRNTVAYRLRRIEVATGWRLADPELRLPLAAALKFVPDDAVLIRPPEAPT